ncbi:hypothetical protein [Kitasatospora phosalacinea]|uniref:Uncharacterized protein n=1 Tax=Kitasatospora phosalacinea TaxID=2065 RepID=A0A9W6UMR5_9ACTN|nr:hypothetical protein [Kitasatospora phosalacinea]GLW52815.1 hypothetical protein Kpho01_08260 [Kitasatospora phosalacinea]
MSDGSANLPESGEQPPQQPAAQQFPQFPQQGAAPYQQPYAPAGQPHPQQHQPQGGAGYGYPPQDGYGYPAGQFQQPVAPINPINPSGPDWQALAEGNENARRRRKRMQLVIGGVLAVLVVGGIVTATVLVSKGDKDPVADPTPSVTASPSPSETLPATAVDVLSNTKYDTAPINSAAFFPQDQITLNGRTYVKTVTSNTKLGHCEEAVTPDIGQILVTNKCLHIHRATYTSGNLGVTVAIADLPDKAAADRSREAGAGSVLSLTATKQPFCQNVTCVTNQAVYGRYLYLTVAGPLGNTPVASGDTAAPQAARDIAEYAQAVLLARGQQALAELQGGAAASPGSSASPGPSAAASPSAH